MKNINMVLEVLRCFSKNSTKLQLFWSGVYWYFCEICWLLHREHNNACFWLFYLL